MPIGIGRPEEAQSFVARHAVFFEAQPRIAAVTKDVFGRAFQPKAEAEAIVFLLGRLAIEDFMEILLVAGNGYGVAGFKLLRGMFERVVTARYLGNNPGEVAAFKEYDYVHSRKFIAHAKIAGTKLSARFTAAQREEVERNFQAVKERFTEVVCERCGTTRLLSSWTKKDLATLARETGLLKLYLYFYFWPTLQLHTTVASMKTRLVETPQGLRFQEAAQPREADAALLGAHMLVLILLADQAANFQLPLAGDLEALERDFERCWPIDAAPRSEFGVGD